MKTLVLCIDRDNDLGRKTEISSPVSSIGSDNKIVDRPRTIKKDNPSPRANTPRRAKLHNDVLQEQFIKGTELKGKWLSSNGTIKSSRAVTDRAIVPPCPTSYWNSLSLVLSNASRSSSRGELFMINDQGFGIAYASVDNEVFVIPAETISRFLEKSNIYRHNGFSTPGYKTYNLIDPDVRNYLKMPEDMKEGNYVSKVFSFGTGSDVLQEFDVILAIDEIPLNAFGRYKHTMYEDISYEHLIQKYPVGEPITFTVWRDGREIQLEGITSRFDSAQMMVPYQEYDRQPEYMVTGGYVFQKLTRNYLQLWGDNWQGKAPPHPFHYYRDLATMTTEDRKEVVVLSFVLPDQINLGYKDLGRVIVKTVNGVEIREMEDLLTAFNSDNQSPFHIIEFELNYPTLVIPKENLQATDLKINQRYGIQNPVNIYE